jgi:hypothetical protein
MEKNIPAPIKTEDFSRTLTPGTSMGKPPYNSMYYGNGTSKLTQISTRKTAPDIDAITGLATITNGNLTVFIEKYNALEGGLRISTHKLLDVCTMALTAQNDYRGNGNPKTEVIIPLEAYMDQCGIPLTKASKDKTRRKVKEDLEALYSVSIEWSEPNRKQTQDFAKMRICDRMGIKNGNIIMNFSTAIAQYLNNAYVMQYPLELLKIDERKPNSFYLGKKLLQHNSIDNNRGKGTANIISVKALLSCLPDMPAYEEVASKDRHLTQRIIEPFERDMDALSSILTWEYCNSRNVPLTEEQNNNLTYAVFIESYIHFTPINTPDQTARLQAKAEQAKQAKERPVRRKKEGKKVHPTKAYLSQRSFFL